MSRTLDLGYWECRAAGPFEVRRLRPPPLISARCRADSVLYRSHMPVLNSDSSGVPDFDTGHALESNSSPTPNLNHGPVINLK
ncbi:hypothetical protein EVAR_29370_1 [Eumeta japonica]|uniref:Uncharacterized protein n=1 Tax=Eumeta variegata TaxID=151549 RepID=A0A4C1WIB0_EUMVA|nr:hypothetical protein EVAR_29370_1 [Eumeta japonica]